MAHIKSKTKPKLLSHEDNPRYRVILSSCFGESLSKSLRAKVRITEAAISVLAECDFEEFRLESVAKKAGVSRPLILHYFKSAETLFHFAAQFVRARLHQYILESVTKLGSNEDVLYNFIDAHFEWLRENPADARVWLLFYHQASKNGELKKLHSDLMKIGRERIESIIELLEPKGGHRQRTEHARDIQTILMGALLIKETCHGTDGICAKSVFRTCLKLLQ